MSTLSTTEQKNSFKSWNTRDLLVTAVISIAFGLLTIGANYVSAILMAINPAFISVLSGFYFVPLIMSMYIVRRPGTSVLAVIITNLATLPFNPFGWMEVMVSVTYGISCELPFFLTRYRNFSLPILFTSGAAASILSFIMLYAFGGLNSVAVSIQVIAFVLFIVSGALLGGWLSKALADAIAKTGVLSGFAIATTQQEEI